MPRTRRSITYYTYNVKVLPTIQNNTARYQDLMENWFDKGYRIMHEGDNSHYFTLTQLDVYNFESEKVYYGVISKFVKMDDLDFVDSEGHLVEFELPRNLQARKQQYEFVFVPSVHRLAFVKTGKIDLEIKKKGAPMKQIIDIVQLAFGSQLEGAYSTYVEIEQDSQIFEDIFNNQLKSLQVRVTYTNDDSLNEESKVLVDGLMRDGQISEFFSRLKPSHNGSIDTNADLPNGLISLAQQNGEVNALVKYEDGHTRRINTVNHPDETDVDIDGENATKDSFVQRIFGFLSEKYSG